MVAESPKTLETMQTKASVEGLSYAAIVASVAGHAEGTPKQGA
jgi:hypothetical protein